jgi:acetyl esterase/lipase
MAVLGSFLAFHGCSTFSTRAGGGDYTVERDIVFTPPEWPQPLLADVYMPRGEGPFPAVLLVHGGGWRRRDRSDMARLSERLVARGFVAVNTSYRFAPTYQFPAQLEDLRQTLRWMHENSARYRLDSTRIGALGYSAGAHLVTLLATVSPGDELDVSPDGWSLRPRAVVGGGTPTDLRKFKGGRLVPEFLGATQQENPAVFALASPIVHVTADDPPMYLYHGAWDALVPASHAIDMKRALDAAGVRSELRIERGLGHMTTFALGRSAHEGAIAFLERELAVGPLMTSVSLTPTPEARDASSRALHRYSDSGAGVPNQG